MALILPCGSCTNRQCKRKKSCRYVDEAVGTGKAWSKSRTYSVDFRHIEESDDPLNKFQREVLHTIQNLSTDNNNREFVKSILKEAMQEVLSERERQVVIQYFLRGHKQVRIARSLGISQPRVNRLKERALKKLKAALSQALDEFI